MRTLLISLLLASAAAATPALAESDNSGRQHMRGERQSDSESRSERRQSGESRRSERSAEANNNSNNDPPRVRSFGGNRPEVTTHDSADSVRNWRGAGRGEGGSQPALVESGKASHPGPGVRIVQDGSTDGGSRGGRHVRVVEGGGSDQGGQQGTQDRRAFWRERVREVGSGGTDSGPIGGSGRLVQPDRPLPRVLRTRVPVVSDTPREGTQPPLRTENRRTSHHRWTGDWRHDHRYNWWDWRRRHRSHFHLGFYFDPFGWNYRPYQIGWRLWPVYYSSRFWIDDPWSYRLPYAPPGYRWIRYYDDLILVDTWDGQVVDVIYNFFW